MEAMNMKTSEMGFELITIAQSHKTIANITIVYYIIIYNKKR